MWKVPPIHGWCLDEGSEAMRGSRPGHEDQSIFTPEAACTATFSQSQLAWRGYSEDEVRAYLNRLADSMVAEVQERVGLRREVERLRNFCRDHGQDVDVVSGSEAPRRRGGFEDGLLNRVRRYVDVQVGRAREYADLVEIRSDQQANIAFHHGCMQTELMYRTLVVIW
jgi:DivIVA domain-containing protein